MASSVNQTVRDRPADTAPRYTLIGLIQKLTPVTPDQEAAWERSAPHQRFERIFQRRTGFLGPMKTCGKLGITLWSYLGNRFGVENAEPVPDLAGVIRAHCSG